MFPRYEILHVRYDRIVPTILYCGEVYRQRVKHVFCFQNFDNSYTDEKVEKKKSKSYLTLFMRALDREEGLKMFHPSPWFIRSFSAVVLRRRVLWDHLILLPVKPSFDNNCFEVFTSLLVWDLCSDLLNDGLFRCGSSCLDDHCWWCCS